MAAKTIQAGSRVKTLVAISGIPANTVGIVNAFGGGSGKNKMWSLDTYNGVYFCEYQLTLATPATADEIKARAQELEAELVTLESQLEYVAENPTEEFDEKKFKVWRTLRLLENKKMNEKEKIRLIASLL